MNFLAKLFSKKRKIRNSKLGHYIGERSLSNLDHAAIIAAVGGGRLPKNGDGMIVKVGTGISPVGKAQIIHDKNGGEWLESQYPRETNSAQFPENWSIFNKEASCQ